MNIFVTGVSSGIGREMARQLAASGHSIWGVARRAKALEEMHDEFGPEFRYSVCDIAAPADCAAAQSAMRAAGFVPDAIILNAGRYESDVRPDRFDVSEYEIIMSTNVGAAARWIAEFLPEFLRRGGGTVIAVSSLSALGPGRGSVSYPASKAALSSLMAGLRLNYAGRGIRFSTVHFGPIRTEMWDKVGSRSIFLAGPSAAARYAIGLLTRPAGDYYYPFLSTSLARLARLLPDSWFAFLAKTFGRKRQ